MNFYARYRLMLFGHANVQRRRRRRRRRCCLKINCAKGRKEA